MKTTHEMQRAIDYAAAVLLGVDDLSDFGWPTWFHYGHPEEAAEHVGLCMVPCGLFGEDYGKTSSLPELPLAQVDGVPILFGKPVVERVGNGLVVHADLLASAYFLLTRYEEWIRPDVRDEHGRFPGKQSLPYRAGFLHRPIVDEYAALLRKWARLIGLDVPEPTRRFSVLLTHDIDRLGPEVGAAEGVRAVVARRANGSGWRDSLANAQIPLGLRRHPYNNIEQVLREDQLLTLSPCADQADSVFFFLAVEGDRYRIERSPSIQRAAKARYDLQGRLAGRAIRAVLQASAKIGLHASYQAGENPELLREEAAALARVSGQPVVRNRCHYLALREPGDAHHLAASGLTWDSSLGYADAAGFRLGIGRPIPLFDPVRRCLAGVEEHPLVVMDQTLISSHYLGLTEEASFQTTCQLALEAHRHGGEFVLLWHNDQFAHPSRRQLYRRLVRFLADLLVHDEQGAISDDWTSG